MGVPNVLQSMLGDVKHVTLVEEIVLHLSQEEPELVVRVSCLILGQDRDSNVLQVLFTITENITPTLLKGKHASVTLANLGALIVIFIFLP